jgi:hypothetical protein
MLGVVPTLPRIERRKRGLRREGHGSRSGESAGELGEDGQVGVKLNTLDASDSQLAAAV